MFPKRFDDDHNSQLQIKMAQELVDRKNNRSPKEEDFEARQQKFLELTEQGCKERVSLAPDKDTFYKAIYGAAFGEIEEENKKDVDSDKK